MWISLVVGLGFFACLSLLALSILFFVLKKRSKAKKSIASSIVLFALLFITAQIFGEEKQAEAEKMVASTTHSSPSSTLSPSPSLSPAPTQTPSPTPLATASASPKPTSAQNATTVNTQMFDFAKSVEVVDNLAEKKHLDLTVNMVGEPDGPNPGLATEHVLVQTYEFLQQDELSGAKTITIKVAQDNEIVTQITVNKEKFVAGEYLIDSILDASKIDLMNEDVIEYGKILERW
ncbi:hypothetical protein HGI30_07675 [Paenibacillus albicereus]|uniref:Uncharacterized protein n=1 Tax=Paenibacillus albicereus TaxID=2726185 RepID=A0A6H2GVQ7_9BACL|nr:hypothetical protein [Paenibacillus albicereus]QJC51439.1 hypothetical protein HGI30_07675 [Paenibacillus albicereus]